MMMMIIIEPLKVEPFLNKANIHNYETDIL